MSIVPSLKKKRDNDSFTSSAAESASASSFSNINNDKGNYFKKLKTRYILFKENILKIDSTLTAVDCKSKWDLVKKLNKKPKIEEDKKTNNLLNIDDLYDIRMEVDDIRSNNEKLEELKFNAKVFELLSPYFVNNEIVDENDESILLNNIDKSLKDKTTIDHVTNIISECIAYGEILHKENLNTNDISNSFTKSSKIISILMAASLLSYIDELNNENINQVQITILNDTINKYRVIADSMSNFSMSSLLDAILEADIKLIELKEYLDDIEKSDYLKSIINNKKELLEYIEEERITKNELNDEIKSLKKIISEQNDELIDYYKTKATLEIETQNQAQSLPYLIGKNLKSSIVYCNEAKQRAGKYISTKMDGISEESLHLAFPSISGKLGQISKNSLPINFAKSLRYGTYMDIISDITIKLSGRILTATARFGIIRL